MRLKSVNLTPNENCSRHFHALLLVHYFIVVTGFCFGYLSFERGHLSITNKDQSLRFLYKFSFIIVAYINPNWQVIVFMEHKQHKLNVLASYRE